MSKPVYSTYRSSIWKLFKQYSPDRSEEHFTACAHMIFMASAAEGLRRVGEKNFEGQMVWERDSTYVSLLCEFLWRYRKLTHYFLAPGVAAFCRGAVKEFTEEYSKALPKMPLVKAPPQTDKCCFLMEMEPGKVQGGFVIHFPIAETNRSIIVIPNIEIPCAVGSRAVYYFGANDDDCCSLMTRKPEDPMLVGGNRADEAECATAEGRESSDRMIKLIFGLSLYMDTFPETVVAAGDGDVHQIKHYDGVRSVVQRHACVEEEERASRSPHWRRGHFRHLLNERYTHKKGQSVYVRGTFVKGSAFDILDDDKPGSDISKTGTGG